MPTSTFNQTITIDASPEQVWDGLQDPDIWSSLGPVEKVWDPVIQDGVLTGFQWSTEIGGSTYEGTGTATIHERPNRYQLVLDTPEMAGAITLNLASANPGRTDIDVTIDFRSKGFLSSIFFPVVSRAIGDGLPEQIKGMADRLAAAG